MSFIKSCSAIGMLFALALLCGCEGETTAKTTEGVPGAFPPTLTDMEYHSKSWSRGDCLTCHETGVQGAPKVKHVSVPPLALKAKCRTCHVQVAGSKPPQP